MFSPIAFAAFRLITRSKRTAVEWKLAGFRTLGDQDIEIRAHQWRRKMPRTRSAGVSKVALDYGFSPHQSGHLTLCGVRVASTMVR